LNRRSSDRLTNVTDHMLSEKDTQIHQHQHQASEREGGNSFDFPWTAYHITLIESICVCLGSRLVLHKVLN